MRMAEMIKNIGHWGNGDYRVNIDTLENLDYLMTLIRQSYKVNGEL
jgi:predicted transport protein